MKRDIDLLKDILLAVEKKPTPTGWMSLAFDDVADDVVSYHVKLLHEANLIEAKDLSTKDGFDWKPVALTNDGHDFLDAAKDNTRWNKLKAWLKEKGADISLEAIKSYLIDLLKSNP